MCKEGRVEKCPVLVSYFISILIVVCLFMIFVHLPNGHHVFYYKLSWLIYITKVANSLPVMLQIFFVPPDKSPFSPKRLIDRFCFTDSCSFPPLLVLSLVNELYTYFIPLINIASCLTVRLHLVLRHWDFVKKQDFRKGSCQGFILSNVIFCIYLLNIYWVLSNTHHIIHVFLISPWTWDLALRDHCTRKYRNKSDWDPEQT